MFNLTREERQVILFLISVILVGLGINFCLKINSPLKRFVTPEVNLAKINLNQVSLEDLLHSHCLSPKLAKKIIEYRNSHREFKSLEELKEIKGIGDYRYEKLRELFFVE